MRLALLTLGAAFSPLATHAVVYTCVNCATSIQAAQILAAIQLARQSNVDAIQGASSAGSTATMEAARVVAEANAKTAGVIETTRIESRYELLDPCSVTAVAKGGSEAQRTRPHGSGRGGGGGGNGGTPTPTQGSTKDMKRALEIAAGERPAPPPEVIAALAASGACGSFVSGGTREQMCKDAGFSLELKSGFPNADVRAETLFDGPQTATDMASGTRRKLTITPGNSSEKMAVNAFLRNLETPLDFRALEARELKSDAGRNYMALRDSYEAAMSLASKPMRDQEAMMTANPATRPILAQLLKGADSAYVRDYLIKAYPRWDKDGISFAELLNLETARRYHNERWHERMAAANEKQLLHEQVQLQALNIWVLSSLAERMQQLNAVQGNTAAAVIRQEKMPGLLAAHKAAQR